MLQLKKSLVTKVTSPEKILIIKPSSLGDIIHSLPVLNSLRRCFPHASIHWLVAKNFADLLEGHPMIDKLWVIDKDRWKKLLSFFSNLRDILILSRKLKNEQYDIVIDLQGLLRSGLITALTGAPVKIGFREAREGSTIFYTHKVEGGKNIHAVERYLKVLPLITGGEDNSIGGVSNSCCDFKEIVFPLPERKIELPVIGGETVQGQYAVLVPGARWQTKRWPPERFGEIAKRLPMRSLVIGGKEDIDLAERVVYSSDGKAISLAGKTSLKELVEIIRRAKLVVSNDSGPVHISAALGIPTFALYGPTSPLRTGPYGRNTFVINAEIDCAPCFKRRCKKNLCMESITVENVWKVISDYLNL